MASLYDLGSALLGAIVAHPLPSLLIGLALVGALASVARRRGWQVAVRRHPRVAAAILVPLLAIALPVGWYLTSPLVLSASLDEPPPIVASATSPGASATPAPTPIAVPSATGFRGASLRARRRSPRPCRPPASPAPARSTAATTSTSGGERRASSDPPPGRTSSGSRALPSATDRTCTSTSRPARRATRMGRSSSVALKADTGNQNYAVPAGALTDPARIASVVIWCRQFSHLFATAPLAG